MPFLIILTALPCLSAVHAGNMCGGSANGNERQFAQKKPVPEKRYEDVPFTHDMKHFIRTSMPLGGNSKNSESRQKKLEKECINKMDDLNIVVTEGQLDNLILSDESVKKTFTESMSNHNLEYNVIKTHMEKLLSLNESRLTEEYKKALSQLCFIVDKTLLTVRPVLLLDNYEKEHKNMINFFSEISYKDIINAVKKEDKRRFQMNNHIDELIKRIQIRQHECFSERRGCPNRVIARIGGDFIQERIDNYKLYSEKKEEILRLNPPYDRGGRYLNIDPNFESKKEVCRGFVAYRDVYPCFTAYRDKLTELKKVNESLLALNIEASNFIESFDDEVKKEVSKNFFSSSHAHLMVRAKFR
jgi:hypothetical protein